MILPAQGDVADPPIAPNTHAARGSEYLGAVGVVALCTLLAGIIFPGFAPTDLTLIYVLGVVIVAVRFGRGPSLLASVLSVAAFDIFFVPPYMTLAVSDSRYVLTFAIMFVVAVISSSLTVQVKRQAEIAHEQTVRTAALYAMSRELAGGHGLDNLIRIAEQHIQAVFDGQTNIFLPTPAGHLNADTKSDTDNECSVAQWVFDKGQSAGWGTETLSSARGLYLPLQAARRTAGVIGLYPRQHENPLTPDQLYLLKIFANQTAIALERETLAEEAEATRMQIAAERLRRSLLNSVSHDLRTPLAAITGAVSSLLENEDTLGAPVRHELAEIAFQESERLNIFIGNLLEMTRLEAGGVTIHKDWQLLDEVIGTVLRQLGQRKAEHPIEIALAPDLPLIPLDSSLIGQVLFNLLDNALKYTPQGTHIRVTAEQVEPMIQVNVIDSGPGLPAELQDRVFDMFYRIRPTVTSGMGLGLTLCKAIVELHGGRIWETNRLEGGAVFHFTLPLEGVPPKIEVIDE
jgi:two-component system sensor histidine kinase KdpD